MTHRAIAGASLAILILAGCAGAPGDAGDFAEIPGIGATRIDVPRPTSAVAGCTPAMATNETIAERAAALRRIGLFADRSVLTDAELGDEVKAAIEVAWGDQIGSDDPFMDLMVAEQDTRRVWWRDLEADVTDGNGVYVTTLQEWATISAGAFVPAAVEESWASDAGPVSVTFELDGAGQEIHPEYLEDWIDPRIATPVNKLIAPSGRRFEFVKAFDQTAFVMALTQEERAALEDRGWCFE